jgi:hypothetical protein
MTNRRILVLFAASLFVSGFSGGCLFSADTDCKSNADCEVGRTCQGGSCVDGDCFGDECTSGGGSGETCASYPSYSKDYCFECEPGMECMTNIYSGNVICAWPCDSVSDCLACGWGDVPGIACDLFGLSTDYSNRQNRCHPTFGQ